MLHDLLSFLTMTMNSLPAAAAASTPVAVVAPAAAPDAPEEPAVTTGAVVATPLTTTPAHTGAASPADAMVDKVQAFYAGIHQVTAKFRQEVTNATFGDTKVNDGKVWIEKPGKMRWDYYAKAKAGKVAVKKSFISNGTYLYVVEHENKQVIKKDLSKDLMPVAISFLYGKGDLKTDFSSALDTSNAYGGKGDIVIKLTPRLPSAQYKNLFLVVAPDNFRVKESIIVDSAGNVNHFRFYEPDFDTAVKASYFEFDEKSVKAYRIVDADAAGADTKTDLDGK